MTSRLTYLDEALVERVLGWSRDGASDARSLLKTEPGKLEQTRYASLASDLWRIAAYEYASGVPLDIVRARLRETSEAQLQVFERRGSQGPFPVMVVSPEDGASAPLHPSKTRDFSLTNSKEGLKAMFTAVVAGHDVLAHRLAQLIGDPPDADYVGENSEVCTPDDQYLSYAVRDYLLGRCEEAHEEASKVRKHAAGLSIQARVLVAMLHRRTDNFLKDHEALIRWHELEAAKKSRRTDTATYLNLPALALARLAIRDGFIEGDQFRPSTYFPIELIA